MAITALKTNNEYIFYRTIQTNQGIVLEIFLSDENIKPSNYVKRYLIPEEDTFHKELRKNENDRYIKKLSTNPEWD